MSPIDLRSDEVLRALHDEFQRDDTNAGWWNSLEEFLPWVAQAGDRSTLSFQKRLWEENPVSAVGQGLIAVDKALADEGFRKWIATRSLERLPDNASESTKHLAGLCDAVVERLRPHCRLIPYLKILRVLTAFFPQHFTTIADRAKLRELHIAMLGSTGAPWPSELSTHASHAVKRHSNILKRLAEVLGPTPTDIAGLVRRITFPWYLYEKLQEQTVSKTDVSINESDAPSQPKPRSFTTKDGLEPLFVSESHFQLMLDSLTEKKNIILQGPPGVGKTFVARRLAYALMGEQDSSRFEWIQFHQSYSYEDFIQGFRPTDHGHFELKNGIFYQFCIRTQRDPNQQPWVFVIDEINRGNMSKIFGELMMLLEPDKRGKSFAMPLTYSKNSDDTFFVPENLHLIGLMNTADRSLAMVDYALRRRFRFLTIAPAFGSDAFRQYLRNLGVEEKLIDKIVQRFSELNGQITADEKNLGPGYQIGHSYFCSAHNRVRDEKWYRRIVEWEIKPLLEEYWLDDQSKVTSLVTRLLE
jgi:MoxR-like ATPase